MYPAITPVEQLHQVADRDDEAKSDVEETKDEVHQEMEGLNGHLAKQGDSTVSHPAVENIETKSPDHKSPASDQLVVDFEKQPIEDLSEQEHAGQEKDQTPQKPIEEEKVTDAIIEDKQIAITFDDGPDLNYTPQILDILKEKNVKATFFIVGIQIKKFPEVVQRMVDEGHLIANHTYNHPKLTALSQSELLHELDATDALIEEIVGFKPVIVRPPYGSINAEVRQTIEETGREVVLWNIDPRDWASTPVDEMYENVMSNAKDEGNILFHSFGGKQIQNTVDLLPKVIDALQSQGYTFVTAEHFIKPSE